jgi:hypothetical protein
VKRKEKKRKEKKNKEKQRTNGNAFKGLHPRGSCSRRVELLHRKTARRWRKVQAFGSMLASAAVWAWCEHNGTGMA